MVEFLQFLIEKSNQRLDEISVRGTKFHTSIISKDFLKVPYAFELITISNLNTFSNVHISKS